MLTSLYIHIPFCDHICTYCDFHKQKATFKTKQRYIDAICSEIKHYKDQYTSLQTIYIGGGTPLSLPKRELEQLLRTISQTIDVSSITEYTIETNPNNITEEKINLLLQYGVNRISIGVQSFHPKHLKFMGRDHNVHDIYHGIQLLKNHNFPNISIDMMFSLVGQTIEELQDDIQRAIALDVNHISYYSLILEEKTVLHHLVSLGKASVNDEDLEAVMYNMVLDTLTSEGYHHYEISNFAKPSYESYHNITYWTTKDYLGLGSGSHSLVDQERFYHERNVSTYMDMIENGRFDWFTEEEFTPLSDHLLMGMRLMKGIHIPTIETHFNIDFFAMFPEIKTYIQENYLTFEDGYLRFTREGLLVGNVIFTLFVEVP